MTDLTKAVFDSRVNYMKRSDITGTTLVTLPSFGNTVTYTVTHSLGYIPFYQVYSEINNNDTIYPSSKINQYTETSLSGIFYPEPQLTSWATTTTLVINLDNTTSPTATGTRRLYWIIYKDYGAL